MASTTTYDLYPLENFNGWWATDNALPDMSAGGILGNTVKFGKNSKGETIFEIIDPDVQHYGQKYNKLPPDQWGYSSYDWDHPLVNPATGTTQWPLYYSDGTPITNKTYLERGQFFKITDNGRSLVSTLPAGSRSVQGYSSNTTFKITGSGLNEICTSTGGNEFVSGSFQTPLFGVADVPLLPGQTLSQSYNNYLYAFSQYATGVQQRIKSYTVTESGLLQDIAGTIAKLGPLAPIALNIAMPGVGAAISGALGIGSAAAGAAIGNALLATALNGGDLSAGLKAGLASYAGASLGGLAGDLAKGGDFGNFLTANPNILSGLVNNVTQTAIKGGDVKAALAGAMLSAGVSAATSQIEGFKDLPPSIQSTIQAGITAELQGKDINVAGLLQGAAMNAVVSYGLSQIPEYESLDQKYKNLAATSLSAALQGKSLTQNAINWALGEANKAVNTAVAQDKAEAATAAAEKQAKAEGWDNLAEKQAAEKENITDAKAYDQYVADNEAKSEGWDNAQEKADAESSGVTNADDWDAKKEGWDDAAEKAAAEEAGIDNKSDYVHYVDDQAAKSDGWDSIEQKIQANNSGFDTIDNWNTHLQDEQDKTEGWSGTEEKNQAAQAGFDDPLVYRQDVQAKSEGWDGYEEKNQAESLGYTNADFYKQDVAAQKEGWQNFDEKSQAESDGFSNPGEYRQNISDMEAGFDSTVDRKAAEARGITDAAEWVEAKADDAAKAQGWADREQKEFADALGIHDAEQYGAYVKDEDAKAAGFDNFADRTAAESAGYATGAEWKQFQRDEVSRAAGFDDEADQKAADAAGIKDPNEWNVQQEEDRIIQFYNDKLDRDPTPEELQGMKDFIGEAQNPEDFSDDELVNLIRGGIESTDYVYGPDGTRYDNEEDALAHNVFDYTDSWSGPVYGSDGNRYDSAEDAMANGVFEFSGEKPEDFVEPETPEVEQPEQGEVVEGGPVWGPDGTEYASAADAMADGVFDFTREEPVEQPEEPTTEEPVTDPEEPIVWEEDGEEPPTEEPLPEEPEPEEPDTGPEEPIVWEEDGEELVTCEPGFHDDGTGLCVPDEETDTGDEQIDCGVGFHLNEDGVCESDDIPEETVCEPGFHDDGTGLCVADDEEDPEEDCGVGFHLNADGVCESDDVEGGTTGGGTTGGGTTTTRRRQVLRTLAKKALSSPGFQTQVQSPLADVQSPVETVSETPVKKKPFQQLGGTSIYPTRFRSVLEDYLSGIKPPEELSVDGSAPVDVLNQPSTIEQYREPDMATSTYFNYGQTPDLTELARLQQEQEAPLGEGLSLPTTYAQGGMVAPLLMARGGTGHGKNAHGALSIVEHSGKHRIDYRQGDAVTGAGDGQSDDIPAMLADGEFVIPADVVAALGNGSTKAGSDKLYEMMHSIRAHHRAAKPKDLPPPARKSPLDYLKKGK